MLFQFQVQISEKDYLEYNKFHMFRSPYGRKIMRGMRIAIAIVFGLFMLLSLVGGRFSASAWIGALPYAILLIVFEAILVPFMSSSFKSTLKKMKKTGKMAYSPSSVLAFYDDYLLETTETNQTQQKYSSIERISIVDQKMMYIHVNNVMAYLLPLSAFASQEEYERFLAFIKTKCDKIDIY